MHEGGCSSVDLAASRGFTSPSFKHTRPPTALARHYCQRWLRYGTLAIRRSGHHCRCCTRLACNRFVVISLSCGLIPPGCAADIWMAQRPHRQAFRLGAANRPTDDPPYAAAMARS